jgi:opacity protein-like surface antigen
MVPVNGTTVLRTTSFFLFRYIHRFQRFHHFLIAPLCLFSLLTASVVAMAQTAPAAPSSSSSSSSSPAAPSRGASADETARKSDVALSGFAEISRNVNGNFILQEASVSGGVLFSFRQSAKPWLGYELNYGYTHFTETYVFSSDKVSHGMSELSAAYLIQGPVTHSIQPFGTIGFGLVIQSPSSSSATSSGQQPSTAASPAFVFGLGANWPNAFHHVGLRIQYRGVRSKAPDFGVPSLDSHRLRTAQEPTAGVYYRF